MSSSRRFPTIVIVLIVAAFAFSCPAQADTIEIAVSPSTLNLSSNGGCVTVHAVIAYSAAREVELSVDGRSVDGLFTFPDSRGELVVRCGIDTIKSMVTVGTATFDLVVHTADGTHTGTDTIKVIDRGE